MSSSRARLAGFEARAAGLLLLLPLAAWAAPAAAASRPPAVAQRIQQLCDEGRVEEAEQALAAQLKAHPRDPTVTFLDGQLRFLRGDYQGALARMEQALARGRPAEGWKQLRDLAQAAREATRDFSTAESEHFILRHPPGRDGQLLPYALEVLEASYREIGGDLGYRPAGKVLVEIYARSADLARVSTLTQREVESSGTVAVSKFNRLMILTPRALVHGYPWADTLAHEYTHYLLLRMSHGRLPVWLQEGVAKFEERRWRAAAGGSTLSPQLESLLAQALRQDRLIPFARMHPSLAKLPTQEAVALAFAEALTAVQYLDGLRGAAGLAALVARMRDGNDENRAMEAVFGLSFAAFERGWKRSLKERHLRARAGATAVALRFRPASTRAVDGEEQGIEQIDEQRARAHARVAGLLRARRRLLAAALEYEKAAALAGPLQPVVGARLAQTYLELGQAGRAVEVATPLCRIYSDQAGPHLTLGMALLEERQFQAAQNALEAALWVSPFDPEVHCGLARAARELGAQARAVQEEAKCRILSGRGEQ